MFVDKKTSPLLKVAAGTLLAGALAVVIPVTAQEAQQSLDGPSADSVALYFTWTSAVDRGTRFQISDHGNLLSFTSPNSAGAVYEHINIGSLSEGYVLCYTAPSTGAVNRFDVGGAEAGWGPNLNGPPSVRRRTVDGIFELTQTYVFNATNKSLQITMTLLNISGVVTGVPQTATGVILRRQVDFDIDTGGAQGWAGFANRFAADGAVRGDGVAAWNDRVDPPAGFEAHGAVLRHVKGNYAHEAKVTEAILDTTCSPAHKDTAATGYARADDGGTIEYRLGSIADRKRAVVTNMYVRY